MKGDADEATGVLTADDEVDALRDSVYQELVAYMQKDPTTVPAAVDLIFVARNLERIADHATNIAEDVVFLVKGVDVRHHANGDKERVISPRLVCNSVPAGLAGPTLSPFNSSVTGLALRLAHRYIS